MVGFLVLGFSLLGRALHDAHWSQPRNAIWFKWWMSANRSEYIMEGVAGPSARRPSGHMHKLQCVCMGFPYSVSNLSHHARYSGLGSSPSCSGQLFSIFVRQGSEICVRTRNWAPRTLQTHKHGQNRRRRDPNLMEDVPDQDSAQNPGKTIWSLFCLPDHSWVLLQLKRHRWGLVAGGLNNRDFLENLRTSYKSEIKGLPRESETLRRRPTKNPHANLKAIWANPAIYTTIS